MTMGAASQGQPMKHGIGTRVRLVEPQAYPDRVFPEHSTGVVREVDETARQYGVQFDGEGMIRPVPAHNLDGDPGTPAPKPPRPKTR